jgi:hypothetical protein
MSQNSRIALTAVIAAVFTCAGVGYVYLHTTFINPPRLPPVNVIPQTPPVAASLSALFAIKTSANKVTNKPDQLSSLWFEQSFEQGTEKFHAVFIKTQTIDPDSKVVMESHADAAKVSVVVYQWSAGAWQLVSKQVDVGRFGSWGDVPAIKQAQLLQLSPDIVVFLIDGGFTGQGYTETGKGLFSYNVRHKTWKDLGYIQTSGDNAGVCDENKSISADDMATACWTFSGEITLTPSGNNSAYPELLVLHKGTTSNEDNTKIVPMMNRRYRFNGKQYVEADAKRH